MMKRMLPFRFIAAAITLACTLLALPVPTLKHAPRPDYLVYVVSKANQELRIYRFNSANVKITIAGTDGLAATLPSVVALTAHPGGRFMYAVASNGTLSAFAIHPNDGALRFINHVESAHKPACGVTAEKKGWMLLVSYCNNGGVEAFRIAGDGGIGNATDYRAQDGSGYIAVTPDNFFLITLGLDRLLQYRFDPSRATFWPNSPPSAEVKPGVHPVSFAFRTDEKFAYSADEASATLSTFTYNREAGTLKLLDSLSTAPGTPSSLEIADGGRFLYLSDRTDSVISVLTLDRKKGTPKVVARIPSGARGPTQLHIDPTGHFLFVAHPESNRITIFQIDPKTGLIEITSQSIEVPEPTSFQFVPVPTEGIH